jgi:hypothetical protein
VRCSLINEYVKKPSAHGMSTFNESSVLIKNILMGGGNHKMFIFAQDMGLGIG